MSQPSSETFCSAVGGVVCEECPLALVGEEEWKGVVPPGTTPFRFSETIPAVLRELVLTPDQIAEREHNMRDRQPSPWDDVFGPDPDRMDTEYAVNLLKDEEFRLPPYVGRDELRQNVLIRQLHGCVGRIASGNCATYYHGADEEKLAESASLAGVLTLDVAADNLSTIARFGTDEDVDDMAGRIKGWVKDYTDDNIPDHSTAENRAMLMAIAETISTLEEKDD